RRTRRGTVRRRAPGGGRKDGRRVSRRCCTPSAWPECAFSSDLREAARPTDPGLAATGGNDHTALPVMARHEVIEIRGAAAHNLKRVAVPTPKNRLIVFTGPSGSGKSSLAFDTIYAEGQRRYVESLSSYARQFLGQMEKPPYDHIRGLSPTIAIEQ